MPQVDLSSVCGDPNKVACETLAGNSVVGIVGESASASGDDLPPEPAEIQGSDTGHLDYAPESFWLSKDAELDWLDRNAFMERKDSGKGGGNNSSTLVPNSGNLNPNSGSIAGSQRYSVNLKTKASIIGLPMRQKPNYAEAKNRRSCRPANIRLFPKRSEPAGGKGSVALSEPSSPKVSCMGRVKSRKDRSRRGKNRKKTEPGLAKSKSIKERKPGFWKNFRSMFRSKGHKGGGCKGVEPDMEPVGPVRSGSSSKKKRGFSTSNNVGGGSCGSSEVSPVEPPGLGGVKRFASGRRSDAWAADVEMDGGKSEPLNRGPIWRRREAGPPAGVDVDRDWQSAGPASV